MNKDFEVFLWNFFIENYNGGSELPQGITEEDVKWAKKAHEKGKQASINFMQLLDKQRCSNG